MSHLKNEIYISAISQLKGCGYPSCIFGVQITNPLQILLANDQKDCPHSTPLFRQNFWPFHFDGLVKSLLDRQNNEFYGISTFYEIIHFLRRGGAVSGMC